MQQRQYYDRQHGNLGMNQQQFYNSSCLQFQKDQCQIVNCKYEHKYDPCPNYDKGFCYEGAECKKKHIVRKICMDYIYGFCKDGPDCKMAHVKLFQYSNVQNELQFTEQYYKLLKDVGVYNDFPEFKPVICNSCQEIGHKANVCKNNSKPSSRLSPTRVILCGICSQEHQVQLQGKLPNCQYQNSQFPTLNQ